MTKRAGKSAFILARAECACWRGARGCLGAPVDNAFSTELPKCLLRLRLPCRYFEGHVLPLARRGRDYAQAEQSYAEIVVRDYREVVDGIADERLRDAILGHAFYGSTWTEQPRTAERFCECGVPLLRRRRVCDECKRKRRRAAFRKANRRRAVLAGSGHNT